MRFLTIILISTILFSCSQERFDGFKENSPDIYFKRIALGDGTPYYPTSAFINYTISISPFDSVNPTKFDKTKIVKFAQTKFFKPESDLLYGLTKGDRLKLILLNKSELFNKLTFEYSSDSTNNWVLDISVDEVISLENRTNNDTIDPNYIEYKRITDYLSYNDRIEDYKFINGIWIDKIVSTTSDTTKRKQEIILDYKGYYIDGNTFDIPDYPLRFYRNDQNQVIPGIMIAINKMKAGDTTTVIIPSHLAFGESGSINGNVPANEPVIYGLKLIPRMP